MKNFVTHVYATVRVKVLGTNFSNDPQLIAELVTQAVCARPSNWMTPVHGVVQVEGHGSFDIEAVAFAEGVSGALVDELDPVTGNVVVEHEFDETGAPRKPKGDIKAGLAEVISALERHPDVASGNSKVHFAFQRLKGLAASL